MLDGCDSKVLFDHYSTRKRYPTRRATLLTQALPSGACQVTVMADSLTARPLRFLGCGRNKWPQGLVRQHRQQCKAQIGQTWASGSDP